MRTWGTNWHRWRAAVTSGQVVAHNLIVAGSTMGAGVLGVAFQSLVAHRLQPVDYGGVFAVITLITFIGLPSGALTLLMARESSRDSARGDQAGSTALLAGGNRSLMIGGFLLAGVLAMGSPLLAWFLVGVVFKCADYAVACCRRWPTVRAGLAILDGRIPGSGAVRHPCPTLD